ncbi:hypothetical protein WJX73_010674 [Symbiochloris irregularis]|uniref:O-methyltransferase n=1 Tax=Symbiochloris irregularis TaxID=706552 RepID=A0AAW1NRP6_9CHLO
MERRLSSMECMAEEGWQPNLSLWEEPGSLLSGLELVVITLASGKVLLKYSCRGKPVEDIVSELGALGAQEVSVQVWQDGRLVKTSRKTPPPATKRKVPAESVFSSAAPRTSLSNSPLNLVISGFAGDEMLVRIKPSTRMAKLLALYAVNRGPGALHLLAYLRIATALMKGDLYGRLLWSLATFWSRLSGGSQLKIFATLKHRVEGLVPIQYPIFIFGVYLIATLQWVTQLITPAPLVATDLALANIRGQIITTVTELGIADALDRAKTAKELASELGGLHAARLERVLQAAVALGLFKAVRGTPTRYCNNRVSAVLRKDHPMGVHHLGLAFSYSYPSISQLTWGVKTGGDMFKKASGGKGFWEALTPEQERIFNLGMADADKGCGDMLIRDYNWGKFTRVLDIGGCTGSFLRDIIQAWGTSKGVIIDRPTVVKQAESEWSGHPLKPKVEFVSGDFFKPETLPKARNGDAYLLRFICHDWNDAHCISILRSCRHAIGRADARVVLVEATPQRGWPFDTVLASALCDINMMAAVDGEERSVSKWREMLPAAGFKLGSVTQTCSPLCIIEFLPTES